MTKQDHMTCTECVYYEPHPNHEKFGWCKHDIPQLIGTRTLDDGHIIGVWNNPTTSPGSFCSKWEGE